MPKRMFRIFCSRGVNVARTFRVCTARFMLINASEGDVMALSSMKSPRRLSSDPPIRVSSEIGSLAIFSTLRTLSSGSPIASIAASSSARMRVIGGASGAEGRVSLAPGASEKGKGVTLAAPGLINKEDIPAVLPILPLRNSVFFPGGLLPLAVGRQKTIALIKDAVRDDQVIGVVTQRKAEEEDPGAADLHSMGTVARIAKLLKMGEDKYSLLVQGLARFRVVELVQEHPYLKARIEPVEDKTPSEEVEVEALGINLKKIAREVIKTHREYYRRQQLKAIKEELGEEEEELDELGERIKKLGLPPDIEKVANKELNRLKSIPTASSEYTVARTYLEWIADLPWSKETEDNLDVDNARGQLNRDHYSLDKVKKRILEYLAVRKLKNDMKGPILCLVGPPGVGKTSLGQSIAKSTGRKFVRLSLGGMRDEAEIRGHRRTYVGALPGRVIQSMKKAGSINPVMMLDEIDKLGADFRGDPSAALLEVLDPEQNNS